MELNKKLAEWAGFTKKLVWSDPADIVPRHQFEVWVEPSGKVLGVAHPTPVPNFTQSLDACFKWLMDLVEEKLGAKEYFKFLTHWCMEVAMGKEPALALCKAIEKLIDGEHKCP